MEEGETKICENCKREIPVVNFTIHAVHCARNIRICPVCKEPVPQAELQDHHDKKHKLLPCKQCGESVCGTDLEDHIRDSCALTMQSCRFCQLDLRRNSLPAHERYCGARTEHCGDCGEWVMHKYRQLHLDSNHGFIRLDDDPVPIKREVKAANAPKPSNVQKSIPIMDNEATRNTNSDVKNINITRSATEKKYVFGTGSNLSNSVAKVPNVLNGPATTAARYDTNEPLAVATVSAGAARASSSARDVHAPSSGAQNGAVPRFKRSNDRPQVNTTASAPDKVKKNMWSTRGVQKRPAPQPPSPVPAPASPAPPALHAALQRRHQEEELRRERNAYNLSVGLPPVLTPAEKIEKLRKLDMLQNGITDDQDNRDRQQGRARRRAEFIPTGNVLGTSDSSRPTPHKDAIDRKRNDLRNLKPMTPEEFMDRFNELQLRKEPREEGVRDGDRFSQIKSSLRELRRGLNEVTAPYNASSNSDSNQNGSGRRRTSDEEPEVRLPCEFCGALVPSDDLVQHQTGCRPDLAQLRAPARLSPPPSSPDAEPVIPCEFCAESLPVYLITEHQERCGREADLLYPD